jgi:subtilisin family serine protease
MKTKITLSLLAMIVSATALAASSKTSQDLLIKLAPGTIQGFQSALSGLSAQGAKVEVLTDTWIHVKSPANAQFLNKLEALKADPAVEYVQPNYKIHLLENYKVQDPLRRAALLRYMQRHDKMNIKSGGGLLSDDNPAIPPSPSQGKGADPLTAKQWGMIDLGVKDAWNVTMGSPEMIVAVIDTGVDYTHEDLAPSLWRNPKEIPDNGIDDDHNGFVDDVIGWDFSSNDNKPYDLAVDQFHLIMGGGNPGHGTHCAGNVAAKADNALGIAGVAPNVKIMALRFMSEKGEGDTAGAVKAIKYAVDNGAKVLSNSWGSEGDDPSEGESNQALKDVIQYAQDHNVLFIAAAGNGHQGVGYDNDTDPKPGVPASYDLDNIVSVAAIDKDNQLGSFSNWGAKTVDLAAPGVAVFSTTVLNHYSDTVVDVGGFTATWDGTSMATPHVAGAAALYWSAHPEKNWKDVKQALLGSVTKIPAVDGKTVSGGKLNVKALLSY